MIQKVNHQNYKDVLLAQSILQTYRKRDTYMVEYPSDLQLLLYGENEWHSQLADLFDSGNYSASEVELIDVPKGNGMIRHYAHMQYTDQLYFAWLIIKCFPAIIRKINPESPDARAILETYSTDSDWMRRTFRNNLDLLGMQRAALKPEHKFMLSTDITNFSPSIDHNLLKIELLEAGSDEKYAEMLCQALTNWSGIPGRSIPQLFWASDIITEFYLTPLDEYCRKKGWAFTRIFDNIEIFEKNEDNCRLIFAELIRVFAKRGLYFNQSKTVFTNTDALRNFLSGKKSITQNIKSTFKNLPTGVAKTYYLAENWIGDSDITQRLTSRPEDTIPYLQHYSNIGIDIGENLSEFILMGNNRYPYQIYSILRWLADHPDEITPGLKKTFRRIINEEKEAIYIICLAADLLLKDGEQSDFELVLSRIETTSHPWIKAEFATMIRNFYTAQNKTEI